MIFVFIPKYTLGSMVTKNSSHSYRHFFLLLTHHFEQCARLCTQECKCVISRAVKVTNKKIELYLASILRLGWREANLWNLGSDWKYWVFASSLKLFVSLLEPSLASKIRGKIIAVQGSGFQPRDKHSRATGFSKAGVPQNFVLQRGDTPGLEVFLARG